GVDLGLVGRARDAAGETDGREEARAHPESAKCSPGDVHGSLLLAPFKSIGHARGLPLCIYWPSRAPRAAVRQRVPRSRKIYRVGSQRTLTPNLGRANLGRKGWPVAGSEDVERRDPDLEPGDLLAGGADRRAPLRAARDARAAGDHARGPARAGGRA